MLACFVDYFEIAFANNNELRHTLERILHSNMGNIGNMNTVCKTDLKIQQKDFFVNNLESGTFEPR